MRLSAHMLPPAPSSFLLPLFPSMLWQAMAMAINSVQTVSAFCLKCFFHKLSFNLYALFSIFFSRYTPFASPSSLSAVAFLFMKCLKIRGARLDVSLYARGRAFCLFVFHVNGLYAHMNTSRGLPGRGRGERVGEGQEQGSRSLAVGALVCFPISFLCCCKYTNSIYSWRLQLMPRLRSFQGGRGGVRG